MKVTVQVTQDDIDRGERDDCEDCPVSLAILRLLRPFPEHLQYAVSRVWVENRRLEIGTDFGFGDDEDEEGAATVCEIELPESVSDFIDRFDEQGPQSVKPFAFEIDIPDEELAAVGESKPQ